jgi:hypothetical protein
MMAIGQMTVEQFFAGLYGNPNIEQELCLQVGKWEAICYP